MAKRKGSKQNVTWCKTHRFKAIENLLRRVAFNLGNTPSKTEVKIVSCIPIDVTDLQHKIFTLERKLEESRRKQVDKSNRKQQEEARRRQQEEARQRKLDEARQRQLDDEARRRQQEEARQRQLEEARQRQLEEARQRQLDDEARQRQLEEARQRQLDEARQRQPGEESRRKEVCDTPRPQSPPCAATCLPACKATCGNSPTGSVSTGNRKAFESWNQLCATYNDNLFDPVIINRLEKSVIADRTRTRGRISESSLLVRKKKHKKLDYFQDYTQHNAKTPTRHAIKKTPDIFGRVISDRDRTRLVYYAQTAGSPFTNYKKANDTSKENPDKAMNREYLSSLLERQHQVKMYLDDDMLGSQGSAPVCRDVPRCSRTSDDMCSCCHGNFFNVDCKSKIRNRSFFNPNIDHGDIYLESSCYDMRPVKEPKPVKSRKPGKNSTKVKKRASEVDCKFLSEYYRFTPEFVNDAMEHNHSGRNPNHQRERRAKPVFLPNESSATDGLVEFSHVYPKRLLPQQELRYHKNECTSRNAECYARSDVTEFCMGPSKPIHTFPVTKLITTSNHLTNALSENVECIQPIHRAKSTVGQIKALQTSVSRLISTHNSINVTLKNAACLAHSVNETECQTDSSNNIQVDSSSPPDKTESALNQIKTMLETVLTEVKTNSVARTIISEKETKDATVQNEHGPTSECERFLNSYTYSPYSMYNPYMPPCSRALPSYCSSMMRQTLTIPRHEIPPTDLPNYPEMVHQTVAAHSCFPDRNAMQPKPTLTCGTNTLLDLPKRRNTETEDLIKEIYKSIKLDVDYPVKISSRIDINESKGSDVCKGTPEGRTALGREEIVCRGDMGTSRATRLGRRSSHSSLTKPHRRGSLDQQPKHTTSAQRRQGISTGTNKDSLGSDSDSASDIDILQPRGPTAMKAPTQPVKKGFFGKVMSSVVKRMCKKEDQPQTPRKRTAAATQDSESSDFETPIAPRERPVKRVSYSPAAPQTWREGETPRPVASTSRTRRLGHSQLRRPERPVHQTQRMPRYVPPRPRSVLRPHAGSSQIRRTLYRPQPPNRPSNPPEYMKRVPHNQYDWRTTPTKSVHRMAPITTNDYKPRIPTKSPGIKITNKTWMKKPVYHLGFACGPEKEKIMMQY